MEKSGQDKLIDECLFLDEEHAKKMPYWEDVAN